MNQAIVVEQLKALGEANRLAVAVLVADREWGAGELLERLDLSQPSLSRHLKVLREAGVIQERRAGRQAYYRLSDGDLPRLVALLAGGRPLPAALRSRPSAPTSGTKMHKTESIPGDEGVEPEEDAPKSSGIEEWLL